MNELRRVILLLETSRAFGRDLIYGIGRYSRIHGPWSFFREPRGLKSSIPKLTNWNADGIIMRNSVIKKKLLNMNLPTILALHDSKRPEIWPAIITNSESISGIAAEHLINCGLINFGYCGFDNLEWSNERKMQFTKIINDAGYNIYVYQQPTNTDHTSWQSEQGRMKKWLNNLPKPIGIMACNDDRGQHVLEICKTLNIKVPEEVAVIGVDNDPLICDLSDPPLSSVSLNTEQAGYASAQLLDDMMKGLITEYEDIIVSGTHVVQRQSTDLLAINDKEVVEAIRYIRNNAHNKILIKDVVRQTCLGRRSLEKRFQNVLSRTIHQEIRRVRSELMKRLLVETNLSISEITAKFDFTSVEHIARYFKKENGVSLMQYRKLNQKS